MRNADDGGGRPSGRPRSLSLLVAGVVALALVVRVVAIAADGGYEAQQDSYDYDRHARSIAAGDGFPESTYAPDGGPSALRAPLYPYVLGVAYALSGDSVDAGRVLGALLGALSVLLLYLLTRRIWGERTALIAAALAAVFPPLVGLSTELWSENLFIPLLLGATLAVVRFRESAALRWAVIAGVLAGLAALTRGPGVIALLPLLLGLWMIRPAFSVRAAAAPAVAALCAILVIVPWTVRNAVEFGRFVPIATSTGFGLAGTYNEVSRDDPTSDASWRNPAIAPEYTPLFEASGVDEATLDGTLRREAVEFMADDPRYVAEAIAANGLRLFYLQGESVVAYGEEVTGPGIGNRGGTVEKVGLGVAAALAVVGIGAMMASRRRKRGSPGRMEGVATGPLFIWLIPIALILVALPVAGLPRYRTPADPYLLILAAIGIAWIVDRIRARRRAGGVLVALAAVAMLSGCGGSDGGDGSETTAATDTTATDKAAKAAYVERADRICRRALSDARELVADQFSDPGQATDLFELTTEELVAPGIRIRERQADALRALPAPGEDPDLETFLGLFDPIGELSRERLAAGRAGDREEAVRIEQLLVELAALQFDAARSYGFKDCSKDVIGEALR